ncbi:alternate-type signal peptide domain-containing protein [Leucobacter chinensis]|uniref:alternate-type signal peptide domain-containing protein n=1 Tax=Leucobacter chinensis TaxID=2851010 RepID=UPI001C236A3F|nr:alternate-type signal peptide domain-containing protein [Leucobacter chinensis]
MKKTTTGFIAGAAGAALLLGGSTFALWSDSVQAPGGEIQSGNLEVAVTGSQWNDISAGGDTGREITLADFKVVPGDTIEGSFDVDLALQGDNLAAELRLAGGQAFSGALAAGFIDVSYSVEDAAGNEVLSGNSSGVNLDLVSLKNRAPGNAVAVPASIDGTADLTVKVAVTFNAETKDRDLVEAAAALETSAIELVQVRQ